MVYCLIQLTLQFYIRSIRFAALSQDDRVGCHPELCFVLPSLPTFIPKFTLSSRAQSRDLLGLLPNAVDAAILHKIHSVRCALSG